MVRSSVYVCLLFVSCVLPLAAQDSAPPAITGTGTPNHITKWITTTSIGNSSIFETTGGKVGIGTTSPTVKFDLKGMGAIRDTLTLFPNTTHPTLAVSGTAFKLSSTGLVTFVAGQTFPGTGSGTVTSVASGAGLTGGPITTSGTLSIKTAGVTNAMLANPSLKVNAGTGLSGGGTVALGGSTTLSNTGVLSVATGAGITNSGGQNPTLGIDTSVVPELGLSNFFTVPQFMEGYVDAFPDNNSVALYGFNISTDVDHPSMYLENDDSTDAGDLVFEAVGGVFGGLCTIDVTGNLFCNGSTGAVVKGHNNKKVGLYNVQSSENWIEDFGSGQLSGGLAVVRLEPHFAQTVSGGANYHVFLTPAWDCEGLYVTNRTSNSFDFREINSGRSSVAFDYRIVVHRKGYESSRLPDVTRKFSSHITAPHAALAKK
jgi:hypothetical protein